MQVETKVIDDKVKSIEVSLGIKNLDLAEYVLTSISDRKLYSANGDLYHGFWIDYPGTSTAQFEAKLWLKDGVTLISYPDLMANNTEMINAVKDKVFMVAGNFLSEIKQYEPIWEMVHSQLRPLKVAVNTLQEKPLPQLEHGVGIVVDDEIGLDEYTHDIPQAIEHLYKRLNLLKSDVIKLRKAVNDQNENYLMDLSEFTALKSSLEYHFSLPWYKRIFHKPDLELKR
jgi:hypothetical protein